MNSNNKKAFTLVEVIVVVSILITLFSISFISINGYIINSRDSARVIDFGSINKSLLIFEAKVGYFPTPSSAVNITHSGGIVWEQGTIGNSVITNIATLNKKPVDPLTGEEYTYSRLNNKAEYQMSTNYEGEGIVSSLSNSTYALNNNNNNNNNTTTAYVKGNYNGLFVSINSGNSSNILAVPSIITLDTTITSLLLTISSNNLVYNGLNNNGINNLVNSDKVILFNGNSNILDSKSGKISLINSIKEAYSGTIISNNNNLNEILLLDDTQINLRTKYELTQLLR